MAAQKFIDLTGLKQIWSRITNLLATKVDAEEGKGLSSNDLTDALLTKLNAIADGAEVNVLESVKVNGTLLEIVSKAVNLIIETGSTNGTISVNGTDVAVKGLGTAAYKGVVTTEITEDTTSANLATATAVAASVKTLKALISAIPEFSVQVFDSLPTASETYKATLALVRNSGSETSNIYTEYVCVLKDGAYTWEKLGDATLDLSGYLQDGDISITDETGDLGQKIATATYVNASGKSVNEAIYNNMVEATETEISAIIDA